MAKASFWIEWGVPFAKEKNNPHFPSKVGHQSLKTPSELKF